MSQAECPEAQVRGCVGDASQAEFNGVDSLVDNCVPKVKLQEEMKPVLNDRQNMEQWLES